ncbi:hypothetical protein ACOSQ2_018083 [Xanthoceras sorbifolium]
MEKDLFNGGVGSFVADGSGGDTENNDQSKSTAEVNVPPGPVVNRPPSPSTHKVAPSKPTNGGRQVTRIKPTNGGRPVTRTTCIGSQAVTYNDNGGQTVTRGCNGNQVTTSTDANGNVQQTDYGDQDSSDDDEQQTDYWDQDSSNDYGNDYP